jgi:SAM domain (Sterile alpha motif)
MDIGRWLRGLGLEQYEPAFRENEIEADGRGPEGNRRRNRRPSAQDFVRDLGTIRFVCRGREPAAASGAGIPRGRRRAASLAASVMGQPSAFLASGASSAAR